MRLKSIEIEGYRSLNQRQTLVFDPSVTVILAANDHGKTNLLDAIRHLNDRDAFDQERDLNWDKEDHPDQLPYLRYELWLDEGEREEVRRLLDRRGLENTAEKKLQKAREAYEQTIPDVESAGAEAGNIAAELAGVENAKPKQNDGVEANSVFVLETTQYLLKLAEVKKRMAAANGKLDKARDIRDKRFADYMIAAAQKVDVEYLSNPESPDSLAETVEYLRSKIKGYEADRQKASERLAAAQAAVRPL